MTREADFPMIVTKPVWPTVLGASVIGAIVVVAIVALLRSGDEAETPKTEAISASSAKTAVEEPKPAEVKQAQAGDPNLIRSTIPPDQSMVPARVADRFKERAETAEKKSKELQKKISGLEHQVNLLESQIAALHRASQPPPPTDAEEVLNMLRPALSAKVE